MNFRTLSFVVGGFALTAGSASAATPEFLQGTGTLTPTKGSAPGCSVCTVSYAGTLTAVLSTGTTVTFTSVVGTLTYYNATAVGSGTGGYCLREVADLSLKNAKGTLKMASYWSECTPSATSYAGTGAGTYTNLGGTGAYASWIGVGSVSNAINAAGDITVSLRGTV